MTSQVNFDLQSSLKPIRPTLPAALKVIPISFYGFVAFLLIATCFWIMSMVGVKSTIGRLEAQKLELIHQQGGFQKEIATLKEREMRASQIREWKTYAPPVHPTTVKIMSLVHDPVILLNYRFSRLEGVMQVRFDIGLGGDPVPVVAQFQEISNMLASGYRLLGMQSPAMLGGKRFELTMQPLSTLPTVTEATETTAAMPAKVIAPTKASK